MVTIILLVGALIIIAETAVCFAGLAFLSQRFGIARFLFYFLAALLVYPGFLGVVESTGFVGIPAPFLVAIPIETVLAAIFGGEYKFLTLWEPFIPSFDGNFQSDLIEIGVVLLWLVVVLPIIGLFESRRNKNNRAGVR